MAEKKKEAQKIKAVPKAKPEIGIDTNNSFPENLLDAAAGEVQENDKIIVECPKTCVIHCKPVYNYQSVEFDWELSEDSFGDFDLREMEKFYSAMLEMLVRMSEKAPQKEAGKTSAPVEEPASEKQKEILRNFHIEFKPDITKKQAHALIKKSMDQEIF